jgi:hypothetical protein
MGSPLPRPATLNVRVDVPVEEWPYLDEDALLEARSRKVCMTCQLHQGLIAHGEHLTHHCQGWTDDLTRQPRGARPNWIWPCSPAWARPPT